VGNKLNLTGVGSKLVIDTLIFDQGGVLVGTQWENATIAWSNLNGTTSREVMDRILAGDAYTSFMRGEIDRAGFRDRVCARLNIQQDPETFDEVWCSIIDPNPEIVPLVENLSARYRMVIGSNTDELHQKRIQEVQPIVTSFDDVLLSYELGVLKPDINFFDSGLAKLDLTPDQCVFIDDRKNNVDSALSVGMQAIQFVSVAQLESELKTLHVC
jgi:epoxide hydrolase-like predicted phosphatase